MIYDADAQLMDQYQFLSTDIITGSAGAIYKGDSLTDMQAFFTSLETHLSRMCMLYEKVSEYISNTYKTTDEYAVSPWKNQYPDSGLQ